MTLVYSIKKNKPHANLQGVQATVPSGADLQVSRHSTSPVCTAEPCSNGSRTRVSQGSPKSRTRYPSERR